MEPETNESEELIAETKRLCRRYIDEVVLPYSLCPWAAPALQAGRVQMSVITGTFEGPSTHGDLAKKVRAEFARVVDEHIELVLVLLPECRYPRLEMDDLLREIRDPQRGTNEEGELAFALAAFHPDAEADLSTPERLIPYLRRSPDPMVQGVRRSTLKKIEPTRGAGTAYFDLENMNLDDLKGSAPESLRKRVAKANLKTYLERGADSLEARFDSISNDRRETHARLSGRKV